MRRALLLLTSFSLLLGSMASIAPAQASGPDSKTRSAVRAASPVKGTPSQILREVPVTEPLVSGFQSGLFQPKGALYKKDAKGCTKRNQLLIQIASRKPKIGKNCVLSGGEWLVDFGRKKVTSARQVKMLPLLPDNYVYAQGAYGWTEAQRRAYGQNYPEKPWTTKKTRSLIATITDFSVQLYSPSAFSTMVQISKNLGTIGVGQRGGDARDAELNAQLTKLRLSNPGLFDDWTIATLLNAKSWGLSFGPGTYDNFEVTIGTCASEGETKGSNPCTSEYSVPNQAQKYSIVPVPMSASIRPPSASLSSSQIINIQERTPDLGYGAPTGETISRSMFGIHAPAWWLSNKSTGFVGDTDPASIPDVPVGYLRLWDTETTWADIEPTQGQFRFDQLDRQVQSAQILDARVMLVLGRSPSWATHDTKEQDPSEDSSWAAYVAAWRSYIGQVCRHYGPSISAYEVWNEANLDTFWVGGPEKMADLTNAAFEEIRGCNPSALVVAASTTTRATGSFGTFFPAYLAGLKKRGWPADAYAVHSYPAASGGANDRIRGIGQFKTMLALAGAPQTTIFDTEVNYGFAGLGEGQVPRGGREAMALMSRTYVDSARYGFASTFWFVWTLPKGDPYPPNPIADTYGIQFTRDEADAKTAWRTTYDWLVGARFQRCLEGSQRVVVCQFSKGDSNFSVIWHGDVGSAPIDASMSEIGQLGSRKCDLQGNCTDLTGVTSIPVDYAPIRIDGTPLPASATQTPSEPTGVPSVGSVEPPIAAYVVVDYGVSNKADAIATWLPPLVLTDLDSVKYVYEWDYCKSGKCTTLASGDVRGLTTSLDLRKGPGDYRFSVRTATCAASSPTTCAKSRAVQVDFTMLSTRAAPPSSVMIQPGLGKGIVRWVAPNIPTRLIKEYEIQVRAVTGVDPDQAFGKWIAVGTSKKLSTIFDLAKTGCKGGVRCQARVRTVLESGLASPFSVSAETSIASYERPFVLATIDSQDMAIYTLGWTGGFGRGEPSSAEGMVYPANAYQLRWRIGNGEWTNSPVRSAADPQQLGGPQATSGIPPGTLNAPYMSSVVWQGPAAPVGEGGIEVQARAVGTGQDLQPSDWVDVDIDWSTSN